MATTITENAPTRRTSRGATATANAREAARLRGRSTRSERTERDLYRRRHYGRTGSRQVISVRGRRVTTGPRDNRKIAGAALMIVLVVCGIVAAMFLSGISTSTSLELDAAQTREKELRNQLEVLERDVAYMKSTGAIAQRAVEEGMVSPQKPVVLTTDSNGNVVEARPGDAANLGVVDLNESGATNPHTPSSNPADTRKVPGMQAPAIQEGSADNSGLPATAPYAPQRQSAPPAVPAPEAPAPAPSVPAPELNPAPAPAADNPERLAAPAR